MKFESGDLITVPGPCRSGDCEWNHCNKHEPEVQALFLDRDSDGFMRVLFSGKIFTCSVDPNMEIDCYAKRWYKNGEFHRNGDKPAVIHANRSKFWIKNGKRHRDCDKPAVIRVDGSKEWFKNGKLHRDGDKPAAVYSDGSKFWYKNGKQHRDGGKPAEMFRPMLMNDG